MKYTLAIVTTLVAVASTSVLPRDAGSVVADCNRVGPGNLVCLNETHFVICALPGLPSIAQPLAAGDNRCKQVLDIV